MEKRGVEYKCESCNKVGWFEITLYGLWDFFCFFFFSFNFLLFFFLSTNPFTVNFLLQIYRNLNCLNKHKWEHTWQWCEASKFQDEEEA